MKTLHVLNGDEQRRHVSVLQGDNVVVWREALADGPVCAGNIESLLSLRREFVRRAYGASSEHFDAMVGQTVTTLTNMSGVHIVLHFDTDLFCVVNALGCLSILNENTTVSWRVQGRTIDLTSDQRTLLRVCWNAYAGTNPLGLQQLLVDIPSELAHVQHALRLHLARFPSTETGLGMPQAMIADIIHAGCTDSSTIVRAFITNDRNRYGWGDLQILRELEQTRLILDGQDVVLELGGVTDNYNRYPWRWNPTREMLEMVATTGYLPNEGA